MASPLTYFRLAARSFAAAGLITCATALAGCQAQIENHGDQLEPQRLARIVPGTQTKDDVAQILGSPSSTSVFDEETWYYVSAVEEKRSIFDREVVERQIVVVRFDRRGVVTGVDVFGLERGRDVELVERETPSFGQSMTFVQQIMGNLGRFNTEGTQERR